MRGIVFVKATDYSKKANPGTTEMFRGDGQI